MKQKSILYMVLAGVFWGTMGVFTRLLRAEGFSSLDMVLVRCLFTTATLFLIILIKDRSQLRIRPRDLWLFALSASVTVIFFSFCYFSAVSMMSLSVAVVLTYTSPLFVFPVAALLFKEKITAAKLIALAVIIFGMTLMTGLLGSAPTVSLAGFFFAIGAAFAGGMVPVFSKLAIRRGYGDMTILFYTYVCALAISLVVCDRGAVSSRLFAGPRPVLYGIAISVANTIIPLLLCNAALRTLEAGRAALTLMIDPVVATLISVFFYREPMTAMTLLGIALIIGSIAFSNLASRAGDAANGAGGARL